MAENNGENNVSKPRIPGRNGGSLNPGGTPGNSGGGRPPNRVRSMAREATEEGIPIIAELMRGGEKVYPSQQIQAFRALSDIGVPKEVVTTTVTHDGERMIGLVFDVLAEMLEPEQYAVVSQAILAKAQVIETGESGEDVNNDPES